MTTDTINNRFRKAQNRLYYVSIFTFVLFSLTLIVGAYPELLGVHHESANEMFAFKLLVFGPAFVLCIVVSSIVATLTIVYWSRLPHRGKSERTILLTFLVIAFFVSKILPILLAS